MTNSTGGVVFDSNYKPFGSQINQTGNDPFKFQGKREDSPTGLYRFGNNYYDPKLGRYISDSFIFAGNNPLGGTTSSIATSIDLSTGVDRNFVPNKWKRHALPTPPKPKPVTQTSIAPPATPSRAPAPAPAPPSSPPQDIIPALPEITIPLKRYGLLDYLDFYNENIQDVSAVLFRNYKGPIGLSYVWDSQQEKPKAGSSGSWIYLNPSKYQGVTDPDWDAIIHEMAHIILSEEWGWEANGVNVWIHEGVADYVRYKVNYLMLGDDLRSLNPKISKYRGGAYFVKYWVETKGEWWLNALLMAQGSKYFKDTGSQFLKNYFWEYCWEFGCRSK